MGAVGAFLVLTFAFSWAVWAVVLRATATGLTTASYGAWLALGGPMFLLGVFAPGVIAVALTSWRGGAPAVRTLLGRILRWRVGAGYYLFAVMLIPVTKLTVAALVRGLVGTWPAFGETRIAVLLGATIASTLWQAGEEVGWRGYLLPRVAARTGLRGASLIVGVIWATWHLPLFFAPGAETRGQSFPLYAAQVTAYSVVLTWLYWKTGGSLLVVMLAHAAFNNMKDIVPSAGAPGANPFTLASTLVFRLSVTVLWCVALVLLARMRDGREKRSAM